MAINPNISLAVETPQVADPLESVGKALSIRNMQQQGQLQAQRMEAGALDIQMQQQAQQDANTAKQIFGQFIGEPDKAIDALQGKVSPDYHMGLKKKALDTKKQIGELAEQDRKKLEFGLEHTGTAIQAALAAPPEQKQAVWQSSVGRLKQMGIDTSGLPPQYPGDEQIQTERIIAMGMSKYLTEARAEADEKRKVAQEGRAVTAAGQASKMGEVQLAEGKAKLRETERQEDAAAVAAASRQGPEALLMAIGSLPRERQQLFSGVTRKTKSEDILKLGMKPSEQVSDERTRTEGQLNRDLTRLGQIMTDKRARELADLSREAAKDARDSKPPTAAQETVALYAERLRQANPIIENAKQSFGERVWNNWTPSMMNTEVGQSFAQAEKNYINSVLRRESGAVIADSEFKNARQQYIPQPGDSDTVLEQKRNNRLLVQENFKRAAGKAYRDPEELIRNAGGQQESKSQVVTTQAQYDALPSGAIYMEDGKKFRKP